jgi:hypothetical protein
VAFAGDAESEARVLTRFLLNGEHGARDAVLWLLVVHERKQVLGCIPRHSTCALSSQEHGLQLLGSIRVNPGNQLIVSRQSVEVRWAALLFIVLLTGHLLSYISTLRLHFV